MRKQEVLVGTSFGQAIAEDEVEELAQYFVETEHWRQLYAGHADVVYGVKGAGKSALYILLANKAKDLAGQQILVVQGENPRGAPVFQDLVQNPPTSETEFRLLWKLYTLVIIGERFKKAGIKDRRAKLVVAYLEEAQLLDPSGSLRSMLRSALDYGRQTLRAEAVEGSFSMDPVTGAPMVSGKITFREPTVEQKRRGYQSVDALLQEADNLLHEYRGQVWILLDRLDVAFAESEELEANALRALFRVYRDLGHLRAIRFKIFMRSDIWNRITADQGFREASHIGRQLTIEWNRNALLNLVVRRLLRNKAIQDYCDVGPEVLESLDRQEHFFYMLFPSQIDVGPNNPAAFEWMLARTADGHGVSAPRDLIHLLKAAKGIQLKRWEVGDNEPEGSVLFDRTAFKEALREVSKMRVERTLYAEYPALRKYVEKLEGEKTLQNNTTLAALWHVPPEEAARIGAKLVEIGFFQRQGSKDEPKYWVPFLYRAGLSMVQGSAVGVVGPEIEA